MASVLMLGDVPPPAFQWPTTADYWQGYVQALGAVAPSSTAPINSADDILSPPLRTHVAGLVATAEATTGMDLGRLTGLAGNVAALASATNGDAALVAVADLLKGAVDIAVDIAVEAGAEIAGDVASVIPFVGAMIDIIVLAITGPKAYEAQAAQKRAYCDQVLAQQADLACRSMLDAAAPLATRPGAPTPADLFRPLAYVYRSGGMSYAWGKPWPLSQASVYGALCGDAVDGFMPIGAIKQQPKGIPVPIPLTIRRKMWSIIRAIMAGAEPPTLQARVKRTAPDGGAALFAVLQDIVWNEIVVKKRIDEAFVSTLAGALGDQHVFRYTCESGASEAAGDLHMLTTCRKRVSAGIFEVWRTGLLQYQARLADGFQDPITGEWLTRPKRALTAQLPKVATLTLGKLQVSRVKQAIAPRVAPRPAARAAIGFGAAGGLAALAWWLL